MLKRPLKKLTAVNTYYILRGITRDQLLVKKGFRQYTIFNSETIADGKVYSGELFRSNQVAHHKQVQIQKSALF